MTEEKPEEGLSTALLMRGPKALFDTNYGVGVLLLLAAGTLGLFPNYYSFAQELSRLHQGKVSGSLGTITWVGTALMQRFVGANIQATRSYDTAIVMAGLVPLLALSAMLLVWPSRAQSRVA